MEQDGLEGVPEAGELKAGETASEPAGTDAGAKEALIRVDVTDAVEQGLVEQSCLDRCSTTLEECDKVVEWDSERFAAGSGVAGVRRDDREASKAPGVNETKFAASAERERGVGVWRQGSLGRGDKQAAGHAEVDEKLSGRAVAIKVDHDGLANAVNAEDAGLGEGVDQERGRRFEGLGLVAGPDGAHNLAVYAVVDAVRDGFDFGKFRHGQYAV